MLLPFPQRTQPSWQNGFARSLGESAYPNLWKGLVGVWLPSFGPTGDMLQDIVGQNHGTLTNMDPATDWVVGERGYTLDFDGTNDYVDCGDSDTLSPSLLTASMWVNWRNLGTDAGIFSKGPTGTREYWAWTHSGAMDVEIATDGTSPGKLDNLLTPDLNRWYHVVITWDGSLFSGYIDGEFISSNGDGNGNISNSSTGLVLGRLNGFNFLDGQIASFLLYDRALAANEIQQLYVDSLAPFRRRMIIPVTSAAAPPATVDRQWFAEGIGIYEEGTEEYFVESIGIAEDQVGTKALNVTLTGSGTVTADLVRNKLALNVAATGSGIVTAALTEETFLAAAATGSSTVTADLTRTRTLVAVMTGSGTVIAALTEETFLAVAVTGSGTVTADLVRNKLALNVAATGFGTVTAALTEETFLATTPTGSGTVTADLTITGGVKQLAVTLTGSGTVIADVIRNKLALNAAATGAGTVTAALTEETFLTVALTGSATIVADLTRTRTLDAALTGSGIITADLIRNKLALIVAATGSGIIVAGLTERTFLAVAPISSATVVANLTRTVGLAVNATGAGTLTAAVTRRRTLVTALTGSGIIGPDLSKITSFQPWRKTTHNEVTGDGIY